MNVSVYMKGYYGGFHGFGLWENKANSKPICSYCVLRDAYFGKEKGKNARKFGGNDSGQ
jgi:hypothetical protein